jgi:hypothetical protein
MAKQDPVAVARELARLWKLPASLVSDLLTTFGTAGQKTFLDGATPSTKSKIIKPSSLLVASVDQKTHAVRTMPVTDIVAGGSEAWLTLSAPADAATNHAARRDFERWVQRALNAGFPVPVVWNVEPDAMTPGGRFEASRIKDTRGGPHLSLMFDYEVRDVPGFGTLPAGVRESRAAALSASLDDRANISFFRIKNSWGLIPPTAAEAVQRLLPGTAPYGDDDIEPAYAYHWAPEGQFYIYLPPGL